MSFMNNSWPNRTYCEALGEAKDLVQGMNVLNYKRSKSILVSLLNEIQVYGNRMESGLSDNRDIHERQREKSKLDKAVKLLRAEKEFLSPSDDSEDSD